MQPNPQAIIEQTIDAMTAPYEHVTTAAIEHQQQLTKPSGSLGALELIAVRMAAIRGELLPQITNKAVVVMAGDHGVTASGVSAYPSAVTPQMVMNFLHGGAAINVLARQIHASVVIVDIGVASDIPQPQPVDEQEGIQLLVRKVGYGTANMLTEPAMTVEQAQQAVAIGIAVANDLIESGVDIIATGEMGIGNTTSASAITAALTGEPVATVTGYGTGIDAQQYANKVHVIEQTLQLHQLDPQNPMAVLSAVGGFEIAGLVGVILGATARRIPVILDGFISGAAALVAVRMAPLAAAYLFAGHASVEKGHVVILRELDLQPLLQLQLRLGEGTGAVLAMNIIEAALLTHANMGTFASAGVSDREE